MPSPAPHNTTWLPYRRRFARPWRTAYGVQHERLGCLLHASGPDDSPRYGEIAPLPECGTETFDDAASWLRQQIGPPGQPGNWPHPGDAPLACRSGLLQLEEPPAAENRTLKPGIAAGGGRPTASLVGSLADPEAARTRLSRCRAAGFRVVKIKAGIDDPADEGKRLATLIGAGGTELTWRVDANAAWSPEQAVRFLAAAGPQAGQITLLEQPCPVGEEAAMLALQETAGIPVGLDESVPDGERLAHWIAEAWPGCFVVKPTIAGIPPAELARRLAPVAERVILSSSLETAIGAESALRLANRLRPVDTAQPPLPDLGWNTAGWFTPEDPLAHPGISADSPWIRPADDPVVLAARVWRSVGGRA